MSVEIIKHGNTYRKIECCNCGCIYSFSGNNIYEDNYNEFVICPECNYECDISLCEELQNE